MLTMEEYDAMDETDKAEAILNALADPFECMIDVFKLGYPGSGL